MPADWDIALPGQLENQGIVRLPVEPQNCRMVQDLPFHHKDPFDRMLIAQALNGGFTVIGSDRIFDDYGVKRIW